MSRWKISLGVLYALVAVLLVVGWSIGKTKHDAEASAKAAADDKEKAELRAFQERKDKAIEACHDHSGVAALGFGFRVVCIFKDGDLVEYDPDTNEVYCP